MGLEENKEELTGDEITQLCDLITLGTTMLEMFIRKGVKIMILSTTLSSPFPGEEPLDQGIFVDPFRAIFSAICSQKTLDSLIGEENRNDVRDEAVVHSLERFAWPYSYQETYQMSFRKICTGISKGWFRGFAVYKYFWLLKWPKDLLRGAQNLRCTKSKSYSTIYIKTTDSGNHIVTLVKAKNFPPQISGECVELVDCSISSDVSKMIVSYPFSIRFFTENIHQLHYEVTGIPGQFVS